MPCSGAISLLRHRQLPSLHDERLPVNYDCGDEQVDARAGRDDCKKLDNLMLLARKL
jgi:hypothetical protein